MPSNPHTGVGAPIPAPAHTDPERFRRAADPPAEPALVQPAPAAPEEGPPGPAEGPPDPDGGPTTDPETDPDPGTSEPGGEGDPGTGEEPEPVLTPDPVVVATPVPDPAPAAGSFETQIEQSLLDLIANAGSGDALEAQSIILRRIALQGDVVPSRVPPPQNITQIGGYVNLLGTLNETDMRSQVLAGILGVAGPNPPLGWISTATPLSLVPIANDRPAGPAQPTLPITLSVRSDFAGPLAAALTALRASGCLVPFLAGPVALPSYQPNVPAPADTLLYTGRVLVLAAATALTDPAADPLVLARAQGTAEPFAITARAFDPAGATVPAADYDALQATASGVVPMPVAAARLVPVAPALAAAAFYPAAPLPQPATAADTAWARLTNIAGLVAGQSKLGDELALLYSWDAIAASAFGPMLEWRWDGTAFTATP